MWRTCLWSFRGGGEQWRHLHPPPSDFFGKLLPTRFYGKKIGKLVKIAENWQNKPYFRPIYSLGEGWGERSTCFIHYTIKNVCNSIPFIILLTNMIQMMINLANKTVKHYQQKPVYWVYFREKCINISLCCDFSLRTLRRTFWPRATFLSSINWFFSSETTIQQRSLKLHFLFHEVW